MKGSVQHLNPNALHKNPAYIGKGDIGAQEGASAVCV